MNKAYPSDRIRHPPRDGYATVALTPSKSSRSFSPASYYVSGHGAVILS